MSTDIENKLHQEIEELNNEIINLKTMILSLNDNLISNVNQIEQAQQENLIGSLKRLR